MHARNCVPLAPQDVDRYTPQYKVMFHACSFLNVDVILHMRSCCDYGQVLLVVIMFNVKALLHVCSCSDMQRFFFICISVGI